MQFTKEHPVVSALISTILITPLLFFMYFAFEPRVVLSQSEEETFIIEQIIGEEISFQVPPGDVEMDGTLGGLLGGISNGSTTFAVATNAPLGYQVEIAFTQADAMVNNASSTYFIPNLNPREFEFSTSTVAGSAGFAYTVTGGTHVDNFFADDGDNCGTGSNYSADRCWFMEETATTPRIIVDSNSPTDGQGDETILYFRVAVDQNPSLQLPTGTYTATATLTAAPQT